MPHGVTDLSVSKTAVAHREKLATEMYAEQQRQNKVDFQKIADACGYSNRATAYNTVMRALSKDRVDNVEEIRKQELEVIDAMISKWQAIAESYGNPEDQEADEKSETSFFEAIKAAEMVLKLQDRRTKYLGLDQPVKTQVEVSADDKTKEVLDFLDSKIKGKHDANSEESTDQND